MGQHDTRRLRGRAVSVISAGALCLALLGCGGDDSTDDEASTPTSNSVLDETTTTAGGDEDTDVTFGPGDTLAGGDPETCAAIDAVNDGRGDQAAAVAAARDIDPPAELDEVWDDFLDGTVPFIEGDSSDADLIDRYLVAFGVVGAYAGSYCPLG